MHATTAHSIDEFDRDAWNRLFPGELEDWSYYRAIEAARIPGFDLLYFGIRVDGELRAAVPAFVTDYRVDTTLTGSLRRVTDAIVRIAPRLLCYRMLALGSPVGEVCHLGFAPGCAADERRSLLERLLEAVEQEAARRKVALVATKDAAASQDALWATIGAARGMRRQPSLPTATLDLPFASLDEYLATLSRATRRDLRRKRKAVAALRIEWRDDIDDILDDVVALYRQTLANAAMTFEELTPEFFRSVLRDLRPRARCATFWLGDRVVAFNLVLQDGNLLLDKFLGMDYAVVRELNLYYVTWLENVRYAIANGIARYQAGQGLHHEKLRLGCRLSPNWIWYRHRNRLLDLVFATFERWFRLDRQDPELAGLLPGPPQPQPARRPLGAWLGFLGFAALSQIAFKYAAQHTGEFAFSADWFVRALGSGWLWVSVASHVGEFVLWMTILSRSALSGAFASSAVLFVVILLASWWLFAEPLGWSRIAGSALILAGILLLGPDEDDEPSPRRPGADATIASATAPGESRQ